MSKLTSLAPLIIFVDVVAYIMIPYVMRPIFSVTHVYGNTPKMKVIFECPFKTTIHMEMISYLN